MKRGTRKKKVFEYNYTYPERAYRYALLGLTINEMAECFQVSIPRIYIWIKRHPEFYAAYQAGKEDADSYVADALYKRAIGYTHDDEKIIWDAKEGQVVRVKVKKHYPPDTQAAITWLKLRQRGKWTDSVRVDARVDVSHHGRVTIRNTDLSDLTDAELDLACKLGAQFVAQGDEQQAEKVAEIRREIGVEEEPE